MNRDGGEVTVVDIVQLYAGDKENLTLLRRAVQLRALPESWRGHFQRRIEKLDAKPRQSRDDG